MRDCKDLATAAEVGSACACCATSRGEWFNGEVRWLGVEDMDGMVLDERAWEGQDRTGHSRGVATEAQGYVWLDGYV